MPTLTIRDLPDSVYGPLADRAARHRRTVEDEARECLQEALRDDLSVEAPLDELRQFRESLGEVFVVENELQHAKREGRD